MTVAFHPDTTTVVDGIESGQSIAIGGFGRAGLPLRLVDAICDRGLTDLHVISNNGGARDGGGIGRLVNERRVRKLTCSFPVNPAFFEQFHEGRVELELVPQGTLAERLRAGGAGIGAFYTPTGVGTALESGDLPAKRDRSGTPVMLHPEKTRMRIGGRDHVLEYPLRPDVGLVHAHRADRFGNLRFRLGARNFNPLCAMASALTVVEAEEILESPLGPDDAHLPGIFVDRVVRVGRRGYGMAQQAQGRGDAVH